MLWLNKKTSFTTNIQIITAVILIGIPFLYFMDVFILGSLAATIHDIYHAIKPSSITKVTEEHSQMLPYMMSHPFVCGFSWITKSDLTHLDVRNIWILLNIMALIAAVVLKAKKRKSKNNSHKVHGLKLADNPVHGTSRWAGINDLTCVCEIGYHGVPKRKRADDYS